MGLSIRAYARHRGITDKAVRKAIQSGRIRTLADGTIDVAQADLDWHANTDPAKQRKTINDPEAFHSVRAMLRENGRNPSGLTTFEQARTAHEIAKAHLARLQLQEKKESLINKDKVKAQVFRLGRQVRDAWVNWPSRISAQMASELKVDEHAMHTILERYVREHLDELGDTKLPTERGNG